MLYVPSPISVYYINLKKSKNNNCLGHTVTYTSHPKLIILHTISNTHYGACINAVRYMCNHMVYIIIQSSFPNISVYNIWRYVKDFISVVNIYMSFNFYIDSFVIFYSSPKKKRTLIITRKFKETQV